MMICCAVDKWIASQTLPVSPGSLLGIPSGLEWLRMGYSWLHSPHFNKWESGRGYGLLKIFGFEVERIAERVVLLLVCFVFQRGTTPPFFLFSHPSDMSTQVLSIKKETSKESLEWPTGPYTVTFV